MSTLVILIVCAALTSSRYFIYQAYTPVLSFFLLLPIFIFFAGIRLSSRKLQISLTAPLLLSALWVIYIILHGLLIVPGFNFIHIYLISGLLLFIFVNILAEKYPAMKMHFSYALLILSVIEATSSIGQFLKIIPSLNPFFSATGTSENPNVSGMFLALTLPVFLLRLQQTDSGFKKRGLIAGIVLVNLAIIALRCRSAILCEVIMLAIVVNHRYRSRFAQQGKKKIPVRYFLICLTMVISVLTGLYFLKTDSSNGRIFIWKLSTALFVNKPLYGIGYGHFEQSYNLFQSHYLSTANSTDIELRNADYVKMAYNEPLQNLVEGGIFGGIFFVAFFLLLLWPVTSAEEPSNTGAQYIFYSRCGIWGFAVMSLCNFTLTALAPFTLFLIYAAFSTSGLGQRNAFRISILNIQGGYAFTFKIALVLSGLAGIIGAVNLIEKSHANRSAQIAASSGHLDEASKIIDGLGSSLSFDESYWCNYGEILLKTHQYKASSAAFANAARLTSSPQMLLNRASCFVKLGQYAQAQQVLREVKFIAPSHLKPRFALMTLGYRLRDTATALDEARGILSLDPKIYNKKVVFYQRRANEMIEILSPNHAVK